MKSKILDKIIIVLMFLTGLQTQKVDAQGRGKSSMLSIEAAVETLRKAMVDADSAKLSSLTSAQLSYGHSGGMVQNKQEFIHALTNGSSDFVTINLADQTVQIIGNTAIVRHVLTATTNDNGKPGNVKLDILLVWIKFDVKGWQLVARQAVKPPVS